MASIMMNTLEAKSQSMAYGDKDIRRATYNRQVQSKGNLRKDKYENELPIEQHQIQHEQVQQLVNASANSNGIGEDAFKYVRGTNANVGFEIPLSVASQDRFKTNLSQDVCGELSSTGKMLLQRRRSSTAVAPICRSKKHMRNGVVVSPATPSSASDKASNNDDTDNNNDGNEKKKRRMMHMHMHAVINSNNNNNNNNNNNDYDDDKQRKMGSARGRSVNKSSLFRGVSKCSKDGRWQTRIRVGCSVRYLGRFATEETAARCYDIASIMLKGAKTATETGLNFEDSVLALDVDFMKKRKEEYNEQCDPFHIALVAAERVKDSNGSMLSSVESTPVNSDDEGDDEGFKSVSEHSSPVLTMFNDNARITNTGNLKIKLPSNQQQQHHPMLMGKLRQQQRRSRIVASVSAISPVGTPKLGKKDKMFMKEPTIEVADNNTLIKLLEESNPDDILAAIDLLLINSMGASIGKI